MMNNQLRKLNTPPFLWSICLFLMVVLCHESRAQTTFQSRDNHTGVSHLRSSWEDAMPWVIDGAVSNAEITIKGYLIHGFNPNPSNIAFTGAEAQLIVEDTLRIHGDLRILNGAKLTIKPGAVLIVHGVYEQDGHVTFDNQGQAIFLSDWTAKVSTATYSNTGNLYIAGKVQQGGLVTNHKPYTDLNNENPLLYYFSRINVIRTACEGVNTGTLTLEGNASNIIRWESSLDFFLNNINQIAHTEGTYTYENLTRTSSFRVYLKGTPGPDYYSGGASIVVLETARGGKISGPTEECTGTNSGVLRLQDFLGGVVRWETSVDDFKTVETSLSTTNETYSFTNLTTTTSFRAVVKNGECEEAFSTPFTVKISPKSQGGQIAGSTEVCKDMNSGSLSLHDYTGEVLRWESSAGSDFSSPIVIASTSTSLPYENLSETTYYRAVVKSGSCAEAYSATAVVTVSEVKGGTLAGSQTVCEGENEGVLTLENYQGNILRWEWSTDNFKGNLTQFEHTEDQLNYKDLTATTYYRAVTGNAVCEEEYSSVAIITVDPAVAGGTAVASETVVCAEANSGAINLEDYAGEIVGWESSSDNFQADISAISHIGEVLPFEGLVQTTSFRAVISSGSCGEVYSESLTITVTPQSQGGQIEGSAAVCKDTNSGSLSLTNYTGEIQRWEFSASSDFSAPDIIASTSPTLLYENLSQTTYYRAVVKSGVCGEVYSAVATINVSEVNGGTLAGSQTVCEGENEGVLTLEGYQGNILRWESSSDNFELNIQAIEHTTSQLGFQNLTATTYYRAVTGNAVCAEEYSSVAIITVDPAVTGGTALASETVVCAEANSGTVRLEDYAGEIVRWEQSTDGFADDISTISYSNGVLPFEGLVQATSFRAVISSGSCGEAYSTVATVMVDQPAASGTLTGGGLTFCATENSGSLELKSYVGEIIRWERSADGFENDTELIDHTAAILSFNDLTATTSYRVLLQHGSCSPVYSPVATIHIDQAAVAGTLQGGGLEVCAGENAGELMLQSFEGEIIRWEASEDHFQNDIRTISHSEALYAYADLTATTSFRVVLTKGSCTEIFSEAATIKVMPQSEGGRLAGSTEVCKGENGGELMLSDHTGEIQRWESSASSDFSAPAIIASTSPTLLYENLGQTTYYRAVVKSGNCGEAYSAVATINVSEVKGGTLVGSQTVCEGENEGVLTLEGYQGNILRWERSGDEFRTHVESIAHTGNTYTYTALAATYSYRAVVEASGCEPLYSGLATIQVEPVAIGGTISGGKRIIPAENQGELQLEGHQGKILRWEMSADNFRSDIQPIKHTENIFVYENLEQDSWYRVVVGHDNSCGPVYSSSAALLINKAPLVQDDYFALDAGQAADGYHSEKSLLDNDTEPDGDPLVISSGQDFTTTAGNSLSIDEKGHIYYVSASGFTGIDSLQYRVCDVAGEASRCAYGYVIIEISERPVVPGGKVVIYQGVSPNGDGLNDKWIIDHIEQYPENLVQIFDRSGVLVYEMQGYDNTNKVFEGHRNKGFGSGSSELPESTYFFRVKLDDTQPLLRGYVILNR